jgi:uncharacterized damage-inducible protein DinB
MKQLLISYANYNYWANNELANIMLGIDESLLFENVVSSFPTVFETVEHIWQAEQVWMQRILGIAPNNKPEFPSKNIKALLDSLMQIDNQWKDFLVNTTEEKLQEMVNYHSWQGLPFSTPTWQIVQHVFNHTTFHRGQLITMLRQLGITSLTSTDFITYTRIQ